MSTGLETFIIRNPNPSARLWSKRASMAALCSSSSSPPSFPFGSLLQHRTSGVCALTVSFSGSPLEHGRGLHLSRSNYRNRSAFSFAASQEDSKSSDIEAEDTTSHHKDETEESSEAWKQTLAIFKEQALKMQSISQEAFEVYSKKAMVILEDTFEQLKIQADKAREDLSVIAMELSKEGKVYLAAAAENSPEPVKDIVEIFASSTDDLNDVSKLRDFYVGIPYGGLLSIGGFLAFMLTGSVSAIRFGIILGGILLALSISSLRSWKKGESSSFAVKGQAAIATVLFLREVRLLFMRQVLASYIAVLISGAVLAFYAYRITYSSEKSNNGSNFETGREE